MKTLISLMFVILIFSSCQQTPVSQSKFLWQPYSKQAVLDSIAHKKPMVIDFSASWCPSCHELEDTVFSLPEVQAKLAQVTALRVDASNQDDAKVQEICQYYGIEGLPTVIFLDSHGHEINNSRVIGVATPQEFSQALALLTIFK